MGIKEIISNIKSFANAGVNSTEKSVIYATGTTILANDAYEQYERVSGNAILKRDENGNATS